MANPMKGEALVKVGAGEFTLAFTLGACIAIEDRFDGKSFNEVLADMQAKQDLRIMLAVIWAGLQKHHKLSLEETGELVNMAEAEAWGDAIGRALSDPEAEAPKNPRKAKSAA